MRNAYSITDTHSYSYFNSAANSYTKRQSNTKGSPNTSSSPKPVTAIDWATPKGHCSRLAVSRRPVSAATRSTATQRRGYNTCRMDRRLTAIMDSIFRVTLRRISCSTT